MESDFLPATDGLFLGEATTPRRWDGSKLINLLSSQMTFNGDLLPDTSYVYRIGNRALSKFWLGLDIAGYAYGVLAYATVGSVMPAWFPPSLAGMCMPHLYFEYYDYEMGLPHQKFIIFLNDDTLFLRQYQENTFIAEYRFSSNMLTLPKYLLLGKEPSLPTAESAYRGRLVRQEGATGYKDKVMVCKKLIDDSYAWLRQLDELDGATGLTNITIVAPTATGTWSNMPVFLTELYSRTINRVKADLTNFTKHRLMVNIQTAGTDDAILKVQYSLDFIGQFFDTGAEIPLNLGQTLAVSDWIDIPTGAKTDVYLRIVGLYGDGIVDPSFGTITIQVK